MEPCDSNGHRRVGRLRFPESVNRAHQRGKLRSWDKLRYRRSYALRRNVAHRPGVDPRELAPARAGPEFEDRDQGLGVSPFNNESGWNFHLQILQLTGSRSTPREWQHAGVVRLRYRSGHA